MKEIIYIAHRLYAPHDRKLAAELGYLLSQKIPEGHIFLPYCDTDEHSMTHSQKGKYLYEQDLERLKNTRILIALLHGPGYDEGVCMEMGYAYASGACVLSVTSDFICYSYEGDPEVFILSDPILELLSDKIFRDETVTIPNVPDFGNKYKNFALYNQTIIDYLYKKLNESFLLTNPIRNKSLNKSEDEFVYIDFGGGEYEYFDKIIESITSRLKLKNIQFYIAKRFRNDIPASTRTISVQDFDAATRATSYILGSYGSETEPGTAAILGFARALNRPIYLYYSGRQSTCAMGRESNARNLMILYGATKIFKNLSEIENMI